jgi:isoleucyl-tRNA synthetase
VLWRIASDVVRLMAPILSFTAEEIWQELEAIQGRARWGSSNVHAAVFPEPMALPADPGLLARWERLAAVREEVLKALEQARAEERIGASLAAKVAIAAPAETLDLLRSFGPDLRFLFITSGVELRAPAETLAVEVLPADGAKCQRCWNFTTDVSSDPEWPGACARCAAAVREILAEAPR